MKRSTPLAALVAGACLAGAALAQTPAAAPRRPGSRAARPTQASSTLHPFAPHLTGRPASELPVDKLKVPAGFKVEVWADGIPEARSLALGDKGTVFVSNRNAQGRLRGRRPGRQARGQDQLLKGLDSPNGVVFRDGTLYVAERHRITATTASRSGSTSPPSRDVVVDNLDPQQQAGHFWKFLAMGPDGKLYFNVGAPGNIVMPAYYAGDDQSRRPEERRVGGRRAGVRNSVGFDWDPRTKDLWFTNHARDWVSDDTPNDTLHHAAKKGMPTSAIRSATRATCSTRSSARTARAAEFDPPAARLGAHIAPLGMRFYTGTMFPAEYRDNIFIAMHGSWNRTIKQGYNVMRVDRRRDGKVEAEALPRGLPARREGRSADVGPAGRRPRDEGRLAARLRRLQRHRLPRQLRRVRGSRRGARAARSASRRRRRRAVAAQAQAQSPTRSAEGGAVHGVPRRGRALGARRHRPRSPASRSSSSRRSSSCSAKATARTR